MMRPVFLVFVCVLQYVAGFTGTSQLCGNKSELSCTTEINGQKADYNSCKMNVYPPNSQECDSMSFGPPSSNTHIGGVTLEPYIMPMERYSGISKVFVNNTVLKIVFSNIKWKTMTFRFKDMFRNMTNHCRTITMSDPSIINDKSVLYYDCYWSRTDSRDGQSHFLDFDAMADDGSVNRGKYYFNIPSAEMLSSRTTEEKWRPFIYIEIIPNYMRLHIMPPPRQLRITAYHIKVINTSEEGVRQEVAATIQVTNITEEVTYDYNYLGSNGLYSFMVTPLHEKCLNKTVKCQEVESPRLLIHGDLQTLNICIASITALIVAALFAYYIVLRGIRRWFPCNIPEKPGGEDKMLLTSPKILVAYSPANRLHAECVASFITFLRSQYYFEVMYDGDISATSTGDPFVWVAEAFKIATHVIYVVGPAPQTNYNSNIYDQPIISPHQKVDSLILSFVRANRAERHPKKLIKVLFEYADASPDNIPVETRDAKTFFLTKDWHKFISHLSENVYPVVEIERTENGRCFLNKLRTVSQFRRALV